MNKNSLSFGIIGLVIGLAVGFFGANSLNKSAMQNQASPQNQTASGGTLNQPQNPSVGGQPAQRGMQADVQKTLDKATNEPDNFAAQVEAGRMYAQIQRFDKALEFFQKARTLKPDDFGANAMLANAYFDDRQFDKAQEYYEKALSIDPLNVTVRSDYATTFFQQQQPDFERAITEFEKALEIDSKHEPTFYNMAITYLRMNDKDNATKILDRLKEANPESNLIKKLEDNINK